MKLTEEEKQHILARRIKKDEDDLASKPSKIGYLKGRLYAIQPYGGHYDDFICNEIEKDLVVKEFMEGIEVIGEPGDIFDCYIDGDRELWYDRSYGLADLDAEWAKKNLTNIKSVKRKSKL